MRTQHSGRSKPTGVNECHGMNLKGHRIPDWRMVRVYRYTLQKCGFRPLCFFYMIGDMWNIWKNATTTSENVVNPMRNFESGIVFFHPDGSQFGWQRDTWSGAKHAMRKKYKTLQFCRESGKCFNKYVPMIVQGIDRQNSKLQSKQL
jgi:hypothetical protein